MKKKQAAFGEGGGELCGEERRSSGCQRFSAGGGGRYDRQAKGTAKAAGDELTTRFTTRSRREREGRSRRPNATRQHGGGPGDGAPPN